MKKTMAITTALVLLTGALFAQDLKMPGNGPGRGGPGMMRGGPGIEWKLGVVETTEYKKVTGTVNLGVSVNATIKVDGVDYLLLVPRNLLVTLKTGDTLTVEGTVTTVKGTTNPVQPFIQAFKLTINGKEIAVQQGFGRGDDDFGGQGLGNGRP